MSADGRARVKGGNEWGADEKEAGSERGGPERRADGGGTSGDGGGHAPIIALACPASAGASRRGVEGEGGERGSEEARGERQEPARARGQCRRYESGGGGAVCKLTQWTFVNTGAVNALWVPQLARSLGQPVSTLRAALADSHAAAPPQAKIGFLRVPSSAYRLALSLARAHLPSAPARA